MACADTLLARGVPENKLLLLRLGVNMSQFGQLDQARARAALGWSNGFYALHAGTIGMTQDWDSLLDAAESLRAYPDVRFMLAGDGAERPRLEGEVQRRGLTNVTFLGMQPVERLSTMISASDVSLMNFRKLDFFAGTLPTRMYEAMASGRPFLLTADGLARKLAIDEAQAGLYVEPGNAQALAQAILHLRSHPELARQLGARGHAYADATFNRAQTVAHLSAHINALVESNAKRKPAQVSSVAVVRASDRQSGPSGRCTRSRESPTRLRRGLASEVRGAMSKPVDLASPGSVRADAAAEPTSYRTLHWRVGERRKLLVLGDVLATMLAVLAALRIWAFAAHEQFTQQYLLREWHWFVILPALWLLLAAINDYYNLRVTARLQSSLLCLARITLELLVIYVAIFFLSPPHSLPHLFVAYYAGLSLILISLWRSVRVLLSRVVGHRRRAVIVGSGSAVETMWHSMVEEAHAEYDVVGCITSLASWRPANPALKLLGGSTDLLDVVRTQGISEVIVAYGDEAPPELFQQVISCYTRGVVVVPMSDLFEQITGRVPIEHVDERLWALVLPLEGYRISFHLYLLAKRAIDVFFALVGLILFLPFLPLVALLIKIDSRGPLLYRQERVGRGGRIFHVLKFRSMVVNAEQGIGPQWAKSRDPRITRAGAILRKTRLDEVPQLLNILKGDMSFVGPRPERPSFVDMLSKEIPFYRSRLVIKPGLTGWAQVRYRYSNTTEDQLRKLQYDLYYIRHQSILLDLLIIGKTFGTVVSMKGM